MMKKNVTLDEDFKIIEKIVGKIKEYKPFSNNVYYLKLEQGGIFVVINRYEKFTIFKFLVNSWFIIIVNDKYLLDNCNTAFNKKIKIWEWKETLYMINIKNREYCPTLEEIGEYINNPVFMQFCSDIKTKYNCKKK